MINIKNGKHFDDAPTMTRGGFLKGILASGIAPSITLGAVGLAGSANASVGRGMMRGVGARNAAMFGDVKRPYDAVVEYLATSGTQYINTLYLFPENAGRVVAEFRWIGSSTGNPLWGAQERRDTNWAFNQYFNGDTTNGWFIGSSLSVDSRLHFIDGIRKNVDVRGSFGTYWFRLNGELTATGSYTGTVSNAERNTIALWADYDGTTYLRPSKYEVYHFALYDYADSTSPTVDFIPVRIGSGSSAVGYMYNRANPKSGPLGNGLFGNIGTGSFIIGPDKV